MRVYLRNRKTGLYHADSDRWASALEEARGFDSVPEAVRFAFDRKLPEAEVIVKYHSFPEVAIPLLREWCDFDPPASPR